MKLPSLDHLLKSFITTLKRFTLTLAAAAVGTWSVMMIAEYSTENEDMYRRLLMTASLGLPLFFAIHVFTERHSSLQFRIPLWLAGIGALVAYHLTLPVKFYDANDAFAYRYVALSAAFHLLTAFSAFYAFSEVNGFWQFNKLMFLRFLTAVLYSGVLYLGLAGAVLAIDQLFNVHVDEKVYLHLWFIIAGIFNTVFFLGGIPKPVELLQHETSYPKGLKIFTQYVLIPLVTVYLVILYAYMAKIIFQGTLPRGWVANLILGFSVSGTLSLLLVWPIREHEGNDWIKAFSRFFYFSLVPLIILLFVAIGTRIASYGVTIDRYIVFALGVWLSLITLYFLFSKRKNIIVIPVTLFVCILISTYGPASMFSVSERSQLNRFERLLTQAGALENGKIKKLTAEESAKAPVETGEELRSIYYYLEQHHTVHGISQWTSDSCWDEFYGLMNCIGINPDIVATTPYSYYFQTEYKPLGLNLSVSGYDELFAVNAYGQSSTPPYNTLLNDTLKIYADDTTLLYLITLDSIAEKSIRKYPEGGSNLLPEDFIYQLRDQNGNSVRLHLTEFSVRKDAEGEYMLESVLGYLLTKRDSL